MKKITLVPPNKTFFLQSMHTYLIIYSSSIPLFYILHIFTRYHISCFKSTKHFINGEIFSFQKEFLLEDKEQLAKCTRRSDAKFLTALPKGKTDF